MTQRDEAPSTYHQMVGIDDPLPAGRFAGVEPRHVVGRTPIETVPRINDGPWAVGDPAGIEPPTGEVIGAPIDIGNPSPPSQSFPPCSIAADGKETFAAPVTSPTVDARRSPQIHEQKRRRLP
jgi:hypothetical protein